jgi:membrane protease YdiL (CAAX protease family)
MTGSDEVRSKPAGLIAAPWHTVLILALIAGNAWRGWLHADAIRHAASVNHVALYARTILFEWLLLGIMLLGVWRHGTSLFTVMGERWRSAAEVLRDVGIALVFLMVSVFLTSLFGPQDPGLKADSAVRFLLPHGKLEDVLWICLAVSAGICEEAIYRGYLQRQLAAVSRNAVVGILLSAGMFGAGHAYQGWRNAALIGVGGALAGALAYWRRSVRPGMIAHAMQDSLAILIKH